MAWNLRREHISAATKQNFKLLDYDTSVSSEVCYIGLVLNENNFFNCGSLLIRGAT